MGIQLGRSSSFYSWFWTMVFWHVLAVATCAQVDGRSDPERIDNFSDDSRAMSPRSWSQVGEDKEPVPPQISFDNKRTIPQAKQKSSRFQQVETTRQVDPNKFFESQELKPGIQKQDSSSSPLPKSVLDSVDNGLSGKNNERVESAFDQPSTISGETPGKGSKGEILDNRRWLEVDDLACPKTKFNRHLGHRYPDPLQRGFPESSATRFSFEEDDEFPPLSQILAQSVFFSEIEFLFVQPSFDGNTAITRNDAGNILATPFNFDLEPGFRVQAGFESKYGPGFAGEYFQFDNQSANANFVSDGISTGQTAVNVLGGANIVSSISADDLGEAIDSIHGLEVHSTSFFAFKAIKFKRAYVNGRFGFQIVSIEHTLESTLTNSMGNEIGSLFQSSNLNAWGPRFGIDYVRKIGHTPAQLIASTTSSILFGDRDQIIENTVTNTLVSLGADEFTTVLDIFFGIQGKKIRGENRNTTFRIGLLNQSWYGGGSALDPNGNFGMQGLTLMLGFNR